MPEPGPSSSGTHLLNLERLQDPDPDPDLELDLELEPSASKQYLNIIRDYVTFCEYRNAKTITVSDVIYALRRLGRPIYSFDPDTHDHSTTVKKAREIARAAREEARRAETDDEEMFV
ncbi:hypothetical protein DL546_004108 [Coniochaeta pulveracea]|uniref:Uncharacterized protein n=1 Tax=Coniochaeta pulveracea TaxID=177199 RepID=A0A420Y2U1_9PEZI|nr:hypothetical protein DL546_004108 [Coniochaeta pulveracea]